MGLSFDRFEIDPVGRRLLCDGREVKLEPRALDMLCYLAARPDSIVSREELIREVWRARTLSDGVLASAVAKLRKALGQAATEQSPIETVRGYGYRFRAQARDVPAPSAHDEPCVGRAASLELLRSALERAARSSGSSLLLKGEPGSGKTRLLRELARLARAHGFRVWRGVAYDETGAPPYFPWVEVLRAAHRELGPAAYQQHVPAHARVLPALVPELSQASAATASEPESARFLLGDELTRFLDSASTEQPLLVVLDDLQWADGACIELLDHAARALADRPLLFAAALREPDGMSQTKRAALAAFGRTARAVRVRGLSAEESAEYVRVLQGAPCDDPLALAALFARTQGNPLFIRQIVELCLQRGERLDGAALQDVGLPPAVRDVVRKRLAAFGAEAATAVTAASVIGPEFDANLLAKLLDRSLPETLRALAPVLASGLLERDAMSINRLSFAHGLVRDALYADLPLHESGALHAKLVDALTAEGDEHDPQRLGAIARHALSAIPFELPRCIAYCRRAADAARSTAGFEVAADLLARLLAHVASEGGDAPTRCELLLALGVDQYCSGDIASAWNTLLSGAQLARALERGALLAQLAFRLLDCLEAGAGDEAVARAVVEQALQQVPEAEPALRAALLAHLAELAIELPFTARRALLDEADQLAAPCDAPDIWREIACCRANLREPAQLAHGRAAAAKLRALLADHAPHGARAGMQGFAAEITDYLCCLTEGDLQATEAIAARARTLAAGSPLVPVRLVGELIGAGRALAEARLDAVEAAVVRMRELCAHVTGGLAKNWLYYALLLGEARDGWQALAQFELPSLELAPSSRYTSRAVIIFAWCAVHLSRHEAARSLLDHVPRAELARMPVLHGDLGTLCMLAEIYDQLSERSDAARLHAQLAPFHDALAVGPGFEYRGCVSHYLGLLAALRERPDDAARHFRSARDRNAALGLPLHHARSQALAARYERA